VPLGPLPAGLLPGELSAQTLPAYGAGSPAEWRSKDILDPGL